MFKLLAISKGAFLDKFSLPHADKYHSIGTLAKWGVSPPASGLDVSAHDYGCELQTFTKSVHQKVIDILHTRFPNLRDSPNMCILTTGSDGRCEKVESSKVVLVVVYDSSNKALPDGFKAAINDLELEFLDIFERNTEYQDLADKKMLYRVYDPSLNKAPRFFPTRFLDSVYLCGSHDIQGRYGAESFSKLQHAAGKTIKQFKRSELGAAIKVLETGVSRDEKIFFPGSKPDTVSVRYFLNKENHICATKYGHLRVLQYSLSHLLTGLIRQNKVSSDMMKNLPNGVVARLQFLIEKKLLSDFYSYDGKIYSVKTNLIPAYEFALSIYGAISDIYHASPMAHSDGVVLDVDARKFNRMSECIYAFSKR